MRLVAQHHTHPTAGPTAQPTGQHVARARMRGPVLGAGGAAAAALAVRLRDPHVSHAWGVCPLYFATGIYCPGCGGLRAVNDLTRGHLAAAASSNLLLVALVPVLALLYARRTLGTWRGDQVSLLPRIPRMAVIGLAVVVAAFVVARNLPGSWLAP